MENRGNNILSKVIEVEKEIQEMIDSERKRSEEWVCNVRNEVEAEAVNEEEALKKFFRREEEIKITIAREKAEGILKDTKEQTRKLLEMDDKNLMRLIMKYIPKILLGHCG